MFADRHILEGSIEHRITLMTRNERLRRCDELLESARRFLPLLEKVEAEEAQDAAADTNASGGEESGAGR
jgi:hypothetical protein